MRTKSMIVFGSNDIKNMANVLRDVMNPGGRRHVFCSGLPFALCNKAFASKKENRDITREDAGKI